MPLEMIKALSIEDNPGDARLIREMLHEASALGWDLPQIELTWVDSLTAGLAHLDQGDVDVVLSDLDLPDSQAGDTFARLRAHAPYMPIVVLTGREDEALARHTVRAGADDYLFKREMNGSLLAHALLYAIERRRARVALQEAHQDLERHVQERTAELEQANAQLRQEITERQRAESQRETTLKALRESERRYRELFENSRDGFVVVDAQGRFLDANQAYCHMLGYTLDELGQKADFYEITPPRWRDWERKEIWEKRLLQEGYSGIYHKEYIRKDGTVFPVELQSYTALDEKGQPRYLWGIARDISARVQVEEKVAHLNRVLQAIRNVNQLVVREKDRDRLIQGACDTLVATRGYHNAWITLNPSPDGSTGSPHDGSTGSPQWLAKGAFKGTVTSAQAGLGKDFSSLFKQSSHGALTTCGQQALAQAKVVVTPTPAVSCTDCPLAASYADRGAMTVRLAHGGKVYGVLCVSISAHLITDEEEQALFQEVADDLAFALYKLEAEEQLYRFQHIVSIIPQPMAFVSRDYRYLAVNDVYSELYDTEREQILGHVVADFCGQAVFAEIKPHLDRCLSGETVCYQIRVNFPGKGYRWMEMGYYPYRDEKGEINGLVSHGLDITEQVRAEAQRAAALEKLRESEEKYRLLTETTCDIIVLHNMRGRIVYTNQAGLDLTGFERSEAIGQSITAFIPAEHQQGINTRQAQRAAGDKKTYRYQTEFVNRAGQRVPVEVDSTPILRAGQVREILVVARDITARVQAEAQLRHYAAELERSNQELQQFAHVASHDLQEPLRTIGSFTRLLAKRYWGQLDEEANQFVDFIIDGVERMQELLHNLLAYSRVDSQGQQPAPTDSQVVLQRALSSLRTAIAESGTKITHDPLPTVQVDAVQMTQLFQNLISNALKFQDKEPPRVHVSAERQDGGWAFSVRDNGIGIDPQHHEHIFEPFRRLHTHGEYPGTGMGLAICTKIVARHGGRIWVQSAPGQGATFYFTLPDGEKEPIYVTRDN